MSRPGSEVEVFRSRTRPSQLSVGRSSPSRFFAPGQRVLDSRHPVRLRWPHFTSSGFSILCFLFVLSGCEGMDLGWGPDLERMIQQNKVDPYQESPVFPDRSGMRQPPGNTVPMERELDVAMRRSGYPVPLTRQLLELGRTRYDVFCGVCHGILGNASSPVASNMQLRPPPSLHEPYIVSMSNRLLHDVVVQGYGIMPGYAMQLSFEEQWAVVAYIRALQVSRSVPIVDLPAAVRQQLEQMP